MKKILVLILGCLFVTVSSDAAVAAALEAPGILTYAQKHLSTCGSLNKTREGLVYLKVSDRYIEDLFPMLQGAVSPDDASQLCQPPYIGDSGKDGAHIRVIYPI